MTNEKIIKTKLGLYLPPKNRPQAKLGEYIMRATCGEQKHEQKTQAV